jgi:hypothetical protein
MRYLKKFKIFNEAYVNKYGKLVNMDWRNDADYEEFEKRVSEFISEEVYISEHDYIRLPLNFQRLYQKICVDKNVIYHNEILIIEDILVYYPNECKECLVKNINSNILLKIYELPYYSQVIEILPMEYQKIIISTILKSNIEKYYLNDNQYEAFNIKIQHIIYFSKEKIIVY